MVKQKSLLMNRVVSSTGLWCLSMILFLAGCQLTSEGPRTEDSHRWRFFNGMTGEEAALEPVVADLADRDVVFLGETHLDHETHRIEGELIRLLHARNEGSGRPFIVSMEMFSRDVQGVVDRYLAGEISEVEFLENSNPWGNYDTGYRAIVEWARENGVPVVAANVPSAVWRKAAFGGGLEALSEEERSTIAKDLLPGTERYWERYDRTVRGHGHAPVAGSPEDRVEKVQSLWDNTMAESISLALKAHPDAVVVHVNGGFHSLEKDGTVHQLELRNPGLKIGTVDIVPMFDLSVAEVSTDRYRADWLIRTEAVARGLYAGSLAVLTPRPLRYQIDAAPRDGSQAPALIWLGDADSDPSAELKRLKELHGSGVTIVVVEQTYSAGKGGEWLATDHRIEDLSVLDFALDRLREQLLLHYDIDPQRCLLAGTGAGVEVILTSAAGDPEWSQAMVATRSGPGWFGMEGLSEAPDEAHPGPGVHVIGVADHEAAWKREVSARKEAGEPMQWTLCDDEGDPEAVLHQMIQDQWR
jgi:uncharacterized iron-regulated protein